MRADLSVLGLGYIGLPMAALCAAKGMRVAGVDIKADIVEALRQGKILIEEPGLAALVARSVASGHLQAMTTPAPADIFMIAVPTPVDPESHRPDMSLVRAAARAIAFVLEKGNLVILQSTSPVGSTQSCVKAEIEAARPDLAGEILYVYCPERAIPGSTLKEMVENDRAIGGLTREATRRGLEFYGRFVTGTLFPTDAATAEMVKLAENASRDAQIAFANELALVCDGLGVDVWDVIALANRHPRVNILKPGPGVGGHCIAVDPWFIIDAAPEQTPLMRTARAVNDARPEWVVAKVKAAASGLARPVICLLGLAYKENVDDFRDSPSLAVARRLVADTVGEVIAVEPFMKGGAACPVVPLAEGVRRADIVVQLTAHDAFKALTLQDLEGKIVIDTRGTLAKA